MGPAATALDAHRAASGPLAGRSILLAGAVGAVAVAASLASIAGPAGRDLGWPTVPLVVLGSALGAAPLLWARSRPLLAAAAVPLVHVLRAVLGLVLEGVRTAAVVNPGWDWNLGSGQGDDVGFGQGYDQGYSVGYDLGYLLGRAHRTALDGLLPASFADLTSAAAVACLLAMPPIVYLTARLRPLPSLMAALTMQTVPTLVIGGLISGLDPPRLALVVAAALAFVTAALAPVWLVGVLRRRVAVRAAARAARHQALSDQAVRDERSRIARELRALVLADLTTIGDRAELAHRDSAPDDDVREALLAITVTGRDTLSAMRRLLGMLRGTADSGTGTTAAEPQPIAVGGRLRRGRGSAPALDVHPSDRARQSA